jgi:hypothetical protein
MDLAAHTKLGRAVMRGFTRRNRERSRPLDADDLNLSLFGRATRAVKLGDDTHVPTSVTALPLKPTPSRHRFEKPIHNVKKARSVRTAILRTGRRSRCFIIWIFG